VSDTENATIGVATPEKVNGTVSGEEEVAAEPLRQSLDCGFACEGPCLAVCGDGIHVDVEGCDDANNVDGDGCSATCTVEEKFQCISVPWRAIWDQEFKVYYYWNDETGESSWHKPARQVSFASIVGLFCLSSRSLLPL